MGWVIYGVAILIISAPLVALSLLAHGQHDLIDDLRTSSERRQGLEVALATTLLAGVIGWTRWRIDGWLSR